MKVAIIIVLIIMVLLVKTISPDVTLFGTIESKAQEALIIEVMVDASQVIGEMPEIFRAGVFEVSENILSEGGKAYLRQKYFADVLSGMTTIMVPLWADSFDDFKEKVERNGILNPAIQEAKKVVSAGGRVLFDLQTMPKWLSSNLQKGEYWRYPPKDYEKWMELIAYTVNYLYKNGIHDADFRIWEEADTGFTKDLKFWNGTRDEFFKLYKYSVKGIRSVDSDARVTFGNSYAYSEMLHGMIEYAATNKLPLDYIIFHPFRTPPFPADYKGVVEHIKERLDKDGLDKNIPIHAESWNSWLEFGKPDLRKGQPDERSQERDTEYNAAYIVQTLYAQNAGGIKHHSFFARIDHSHDRYTDAGLINRTQQFYGGWGLFTKDLIIKPVFNAFKALSIASGMKEYSMSYRLNATFDEQDMIIAIASRTRDRNTIRVLLSHAVDVPAERAGYLKKHMADKYKNKYLKAYYGDSLNTFKKCAEKDSINYECISTLPVDIRSFISCVAEKKGAQCLQLMPEHLQKFGEHIEHYLQNYMKEVKEVNIEFNKLPYKGNASLSIYTIDNNNANSCRYNKRTEKIKTHTECGINGEIDNMARLAREGAIKVTNAIIKKFPFLRPNRQEITDSLFYFGKYTVPDGTIVTNHRWIDYINNDPNVSLEGTKRTSKINIGSDYSHKETIKLQPYGVVLVEISRAN